LAKKVKDEADKKIELLENSKKGAPKKALTSKNVTVRAKGTMNKENITSNKILNLPIDQTIL
jgi:hypothetical protein